MKLKLIIVMANSLSQCLNHTGNKGGIGYGTQMCPGIYFLGAAVLGPPYEVTSLMPLFSAWQQLEAPSIALFHHSPKSLSSMALNVHDIQEIEGNWCLGRNPSLSFCQKCKASVLLRKGNFCGDLWAGFTRGQWTCLFQSTCIDLWLMVFFFFFLSMLYPPMGYFCFVT